MSSEQTIQDYFHLKYQNYELDPKGNKEHRDFFAPRSIDNSTISNHLDKMYRDLASANVPKRL